jgi:hypothetical protein
MSYLLCFRKNIGCYIRELGDKRRNIAKKTGTYYEN